MVRNGRKVGISMVALVITIIVLIVLTGAVVITGVGAPKQAQLAVFKSNVATIQDAVTMKMGNNMITAALEGKDDDYKWLGIVKDYNGTNDIGFTNGEIIAGESVLPLSTELRSTVKISEEELANYYVSEEGIVYHIGFVSDGVTYYNNNVVGGTYTMTELWQDPSKGTQGATISMSTAQELKDLATYINEGNNTKGVTFKLMNDITLNENVLNSDGTLNETNSANFEQWIPIGTPKTTGSNGGLENNVNDIKFSGVFDGNGYNVSGIYINQEELYGQAFIAYNDGIIQNLNIVDSYIHAGLGIVGGICGVNEGVIGNCSNCGTISKVGNKWYAGGIVAWNSGGIIKNCYNTGKIMGTHAIAGIVGVSTYNSLVINCYNTANIQSTQTRPAGIVAYLSSSTVVNCYNIGNTTGKYVQGGIVACDDRGPNVIKNCYNAGNVNGTTQLGGIIGSCSALLNLTNVYNLGVITGNNADNVGNIAGNSSNDAVVNNVYSTSEPYFGTNFTSTVENQGIISANNTITVGSEEIHVIKALNNWVEENKTTYPELKYWDWDSDNDRPMFTDNRPSEY